MKEPLHAPADDPTRYRMSGPLQLLELMRSTSAVGGKDGVNSSPETQFYYASGHAPSQLLYGTLGNANHYSI